MAVNKRLLHGYLSIGLLLVSMFSVGIAVSTPEWWIVKFKFEGVGYHMAFGLGKFEGYLAPFPCPVIPNTTYPETRAPTTTTTGTNTSTGATTAVGTTTISTTTAATTTTPTTATTATTFPTTAAVVTSAPLPVQASRGKLVLTQMELWTPKCTAHGLGDCELLMCQAWTCDSLLQARKDGNNMYSNHHVSPAWQFEALCARSQASMSMFILGLIPIPFAILVTWCATNTEFCFCLKCTRLTVSAVLCAVLSCVSASLFAIGTLVYAVGVGAEANAEWWTGAYEMGPGYSLAVGIVAAGLALGTAVNSIFLMRIVKHIDAEARIAAHLPASPDDDLTTPGPEKRTPGPTRPGTRPGTSRPRNVEEGPDDFGMYNGTG